MSTVRWAGFLLLGVTCTAGWFGVRSWILAGLMGVSVLIILWSFRGRERWEPEMGEFERLEAEIREYENARAERARRIGVDDVE